MSLLSSKKAQISVEFLFYLGILIFAITTYTLYFQTTIKSSTSDIKTIESIELLKEIRDTLVFAYFQGNGYSINVSLPSTINNYNYSISLTSSGAYMDINKKTYYLPLIPLKINGSFVPGTINEISNMRGEIYIKQYS